jgi:hypothetical protein
MSTHLCCLFASYTLWHHVFITQHISVNMLITPHIAVNMLIPPHIAVNMLTSIERTDASVVANRYKTGSPISLSSFATDGLLNPPSDRTSDGLLNPPSGRASDVLHNPPDDRPNPGANGQLNPPSGRPVRRQLDPGMRTYSTEWCGCTVTMTIVASSSSTALGRVTERGVCEDPFVAL